MGLVLLDLALLEPQSNLLLGVLDAVGAVADVAADVDGEVATDGAGGRGEGVGGAEEDCWRQKSAFDLFQWVELARLVRRDGIANERSVRTTTGLDGITALPDHGGDRAALHVCEILLALLPNTSSNSDWGGKTHTGEKTGEEGLLLQVSV